MTDDQQPRRDSSAEADAIWRTLASAAHVESAGLTCPSGFAERVVANLPDRCNLVAASEQQRLVSAAACVALAASLLVCLLSWRDLEAAWSGPPVVIAPVVSLEPWP